MVERSGVVSQVLLVVLGLPASAQVNSWLKPTSGSWEEPQWSLGALPASGQTILITNAGSKAVMISPSTVKEDPGSLVVDSITVSSPANSRNQLTLNYADVQNPLTVNSMTVESNSTVTLLSSALQLNGPAGLGLSIGGDFNQDVSSTVAGNQIDIGYIGRGIYNLISGNLSVGQIWVGGTFKGVLNQTGGSNAAGIVHLDTGGRYTLEDGDFSANVYFDGGSLFDQQGGRINAGLSIWQGTYFLENGVVYGGLVIPTSDGYSIAGGNAQMIQTGGTNFGAIDVGEFGPGYYTLSNGVSFAPGFTIAAYGAAQQWGGYQSVNGQLAITWDYVDRDDISSGSYTLNAGILTSTSLEVDGSFLQTGGTNVVSGDVTMNGPFADFELVGGELRAAGISVGPGWEGGFTQKGGRLVITNQLTVTSGGTAFWTGLSLDDGELDVSNIVLMPGAVFTQNGGVLAQSGILDLAAAGVYLGGGTHQFGPVQLGAGSPDSTNSMLHMPSSACVVNFGDSSSVGWTNTAALTIENWAGSWVGGGSQQILFGSSSTALTAAQLSQILFDKPAGLAPAIYHARLLATGEVVPDGIPPTGFFQPLLTVLRQNDGAMQLSIHGEAGANYRIDVSSDCSNWSAWTNLTTPSGIFLGVDFEATNYPARFYRAVLLGD